MRAVLTAAQATQAVSQPAIGAVTTLIPKPQGTSGCGGFNLAKEMKVDTKVCHEIQVSIPLFTLIVC